MLKSLNADLTPCVATKKKKNNTMYKNSKYVWKYNDMEDYSPHFDSAQIKLIKKRNLNKKHKWRKLIKIKIY